MKLWFLLNDPIACVCWRVKYFDSMSGLDDCGEAISLVDSQFVVKTLLGDWSVVRLFRFVFNSFKYLRFSLETSDRILITYSFLVAFLG